MLTPDLPPTDFPHDEISDSRLIFVGDRLTSTNGVSIGHNLFTTGSKRLSLGVELEPGEIGVFDSLEVDVENCSKDSALVGLTLRHGTENLDKSSSKISFSGGRELLERLTRARLTFPIESFGFYGQTPDWTTACFLELFVIRDRDQVSFDPISIKLFGIYGVRRRKPNGPRLQRSGLAKVLRTDFTGLTHFKPSNQPIQLFFRDVSQTDQPVPFTISDESHLIPAPHPYSTDSAEKILQGIIMGEPILGIPDWSHNPLGAHEWTHFLNRHHFLRPLALHSAKTGCSKCASTIDRVIENWILSNPVPLNSNGGAGPTWETLTVAWRLREWFWVIGLTWTHPSFSEETRLLMLSSIWEHARSLMDHQGHPNNWIIVESCALAITGLLFPQFQEAKSWFQVGAQRIFQQCEKQFFDDGAHFEISPLYHSICLNSLLEFRSVAAFRSTGVPGEFDSKLQKAAFVLNSLKRPDGTWPSINDSGGVRGDYSALTTKIHNFFGELPTTHEKISDGHFNFPEPEHFRDCGLVIMRSGNPEPDSFLIFRSGPAGAAHSHNDNLSLDVCFNGRPGLIDPGIREYAPGPLSDYYRSAESHNVVLVDDLEPSRSALKYQSRIRPADKNLMVESYENLIVAHGLREKEEFEQVEHFHSERTVIFVKGLFWIIRDFITGQGRHKISTLWKCYPSDVKVEESSLIATVTNELGLNFQIVPIFIRNGLSCNVWRGSHEPPRGWAAIDGKNIPAPLVEYSLSTDLPKVLFWGLFPSCKSGGFPSLRNLACSSEDEVSIEVQHPDSGLNKIRIGSLENRAKRETGIFISKLVYLEE